MTQWSLSRLTAIQALVLEPMMETSSHTTQQLIRVCLSTVISACWATLDWSWSKKWNWCLQADLHLEKKKGGGKHRLEMFHWNFPKDPCVQGKSHHHHSYPYMMWLTVSMCMHGWGDCVLEDLMIFLWFYDFFQHSVIPPSLATVTSAVNIPVWMKT